MNMKNNLTILLVALIGSFLITVKASAQANIDYAAFPTSSDEETTPLVMLSISADHQYFFKAYSDFSDLDPRDDGTGDGPEVTYENNIEYYGYFDSTKCYTYNTGLERYVPEAIQLTDYYCDDVAGDWSGNFLNWSTMTRMDVVRKIFYGGFRSIDSSTLTVLERAHLPTDAHSFAKYYNGDDIPKLTPFTLADVNWEGDDATNNVNGNTRTDTEDFDDFEEGITICNTTADFNANANGNAVSQTSEAPPLMRVVRGNFQLWAANERWQCTWNDEATGNGGPDSSNGNDSVGSGIAAYSQDPDRVDDALLTAGGQEDRIVRVEVCNDFIDPANNLENCDEYPDGNSKPQGILHQFGEQGQIQFGLMTGGFEANTEGGVLRKRIREFADEVNVDTDGTYTGAAGIVSNLNALRMYGYRYGNGTYFGGNSGDTCGFQQTDIEPGQCFSWGNPISEILKESVNYLTGGTPTPEFNVDDSARLPGVTVNGVSIVPGLTIEDWEGGPIDDDNQCADVTQIVINASVSSFDENTDISFLLGNPDVDASTDDVGDIEGISGNDYFVGISDTNADSFCTSKTVNTLSDVRGICPGAPTVNGSYAAAGIAYHAHTNDLRAFEDDQTIETLAITLATNSAVINVPIGPVGTEQSMNIVPAYRLQRDTGGGGALVDFKIVKSHTETFTGSGIFEGAFYLNWEDSEQGGDFDNDVWGTIKYELDINLTPARIEITTDVVSETTNRPQLFGFVTSGTEDDGFHAFSGIEGAEYTNIAGIVECDDCQVGDPAVTYTVNIETTNVAEELESPLYYVAKYGSFDELDGLDGPTAPEEYDTRDNLTGFDGADGIPDGFFAATSPQALVDSIDRALNEVLQTGETSGGSPGTLGNSEDGLDLLVQAVYFNNVESEDDTEEAVSWVGQLIGVFIDENGNFREDGNQDGNLGVTSVDNVFRYDATGTALQIVRSRLTDDAEPFNADTNPYVDIETVLASELLPIWSAADELSNLDNEGIEDNRNYSDEVDTTGASRYIFTWVDTDGNGISEAGEVIPFESDEVTLDSDFQGFLGLAGNDPVLNQQAKNIVDFIRGKEDLSRTIGTRDRTINEIDDPEIKRLGDIVNSSPTVVAAPSENYDVTNDDATYGAFKAQYQNRRNVVYVGANDGLLHAFNAGFKSETVDFSTIFSEDGFSGETSHPLGAELWAYAPMNLLPHMQWLADPAYLHTYYMDGEVTVFDVNIFTEDAVHPGGWGTILVVGMGLGGGEYNLGLDVGGDGDTSNNLTRSSYVVLDVTDPEQEPVLLGEISHPDLDQATTKPTIFKRRIPGAGFDYTNLTAANNKWQLVFGSGPDNRIDYTGSGDASVFTLDLEISGGRLTDTTPTAMNVPNPGGEGAFVGSLVSADWGSDYIDDVVYFGTVEQAGDPDEHTGGLFRLLPDSSTVNIMMDIDRPIESTPIAQTVEGQNFVYAGTGRFFTNDDAPSDDQEYYMGIREQDSGFTTTFTLASLLNITDFQVLQEFDTEGNITFVEVQEVANTESTTFDGADGTVTDGKSSFEELSEYILAGDGSTNGWVRELETSNNNPSERVVSDGATSDPLLVFVTFTPTVLICEPELGSASLFAVDLVTGTASALAPFDPFLNSSNSGGGGSRVASFMNDPTASNKPGDVVLFETPDGNLKVLASTGDGGNIDEVLNLSSPSKVIRINWREIIQ